MRSRIVALSLALVAAGGALLPARAADPAPPRHAMLDVTGVRTSESATPGSWSIADGLGPGSPLLIDFDYEPDGEVDATGLCTANYIWRDARTAALYLGAAGHCFLPQAEDPGGFKAAAVHTDPWVTRVRACVRGCAFGGATALLTDGVFFGEWRDLGRVRFARQSADAEGEDAVGHDFGLVAIPSGLVGRIRTSMPQWGGPTGTTSVDDALGVCFYGNAAAYGETHLTKPRDGIGLFEEDGSWSATMPSMQGDSGAALNDCGSLKAIGLVTHVVTGTPIAFGTTVRRAVEMAREGGLELSLVTRL